MATVVGEAGESALRKALLRALLLPAVVLIPIAVAFPFIAIAYFRSTNHAPVIALTAVMTCAGAFLFRKDLGEALELSIESRDWARGAAGERAASQDLSLLPDDYLILNDVHPGFRGLNERWNWDHVVIGPKGIFVVDSKNYSANRIKDGATDARTRRNVKQVRGYAVSFKSELVRLNPNLSNVFIVPVLAYVNASWVERLREADVRVLPKRLLRKDILTGLASGLSASEAVKIANLIFGMYPVHLQAAYRDDFRRWAERVRQSHWDGAPPVAARPRSTEQAWLCPECGAPMKRHDRGYKPFFGCSTYRVTGCGGKRELDGTVIADREIPMEAGR